MTPLMRMLYEYGDEQNIRKWFLDKEHTKYKRAVSQRYDEIVKKYPELASPLDDLISDMMIRSVYAEEAAFQVGFMLHGALRRLQDQYSKLGILYRPI